MFTIQIFQRKNYQTKKYLTHPKQKYVPIKEFLQIHRLHPTSGRLPSSTIIVMWRQRELRIPKKRNMSRHRKECLKKEHERPKKET